MLRAGFVALVDVDVQRDVPALLGRERLLDPSQVARDQREQVGGFRKRIVPQRVMPAVGEIAALLEIAVAQQNRVFGLLCDHFDRENAHVVGAVDEVGNAPEAVRLALGAVDAAGTVKPLQFGVGVGIDFRHDLNGRFFPRLEERQRIFGALISLRGELDVVDLDAEQLQRIAVEHERFGCFALALDAHAVDHQRMFVEDLERQFDVAYAVGVRPVIGEIDGLGLVHGFVRNVGIAEILPNPTV